MTSELAPPEYWANLLRHIRSETGWSQEELASEFGVSRITLNRWEKQAKYPSVENQRKIGELANRRNIASVYGVVQVVNKSPFPMILTDVNDYVLAASQCSGFRVGELVIDQTPSDEQESYRTFSRMVADTGFWKEADNYLEYEFNIGGQTRRAIIHSVGSRGHIFALVQKI
jgi:transcriptional regulator with XRE-family HTH domain